MRYDLDFKIKVITYYEQQNSGLAASEKFNIGLRFVRLRVKQYQSGDIDAISSNTTKAKYRSTVASLN